MSGHQLVLPLRAAAVYTDDEGNGYGGIFDANDKEVATCTMLIDAMDLAALANAGAAEQEVRRLNDVIRVKNGTIDNLREDSAGKMKIIRTLQAQNAELVETLQLYAGDRDPSASELLAAIAKAKGAA